MNEKLCAEYNGGVEASPSLLRQQERWRCRVPTAPKVSSTGGRRAILEQELTNERQALANEQKALAAARTAKGGNVDQQHISRLQGSVLDRQQNIQALQRELSRI